ncbi:MAG: SLBB domain-containing protein [bacterium]|nr:SLBB domain-containing protein [bacterium]
MTGCRFAVSFFLILYILFPFAGNGQGRAIKPGDAIEIIFSGNESLTQTVLVNPEGMVDYPAMQGLPVDGITLQRFHEILITQLSRYMETIPLVLVRFSDSYPINVTVLGQVARPGLYAIANTATLQGAIGAAGGFIPGAQLSKIKLIRTTDIDQNHQVVNMEKFYLEGDPASLPPLKQDDTIVVPGNPLATNVKVLGCVENPGNYEVFFQTTILDVIFLAGGTTEDANLNKIKIVSFTGQNSREVKINIKKLLQSKDVSSIPVVVPGDVVYIPKKFMNWKKIVGLIKDATTFAMLYYIIIRSKNT